MSTDDQNYQEWKKAQIEAERAALLNKAYPRQTLGGGPPDQAVHTEPTLARFGKASHQVALKLSELEDVVTVLIDGPAPTGGTGQPESDPAHRYQSVRHAICNHPDELEIFAERLDAQINRLRDAF